jgi:polyadenylate-binding protein
VTFAENSELERCLKEMNNIKVQSQSIILNRQGDNTRNPLANIIIQGIPKNLNQSDVYTVFKKFGDIKSCKLQTYQDNTSKGFAFVQYDRPEQAQAAISELNDKPGFNGATLKIDIFKKQHERIDPNAAQPQKPYTNLYVHGLESGTTVEQVKAMFAPIGEIESCSLKDKATGIAFVCYKRPDDAARAV